MTDLSRQQETPPAAKLDADKVREIRASMQNDYVLARRYGVDAKTIHLARNRKTWRHVD